MDRAGVETLAGAAARYRSRFRYSEVRAGRTGHESSFPLVVGCGADVISE